jgi:hypothetical protein
MTEAQMKKARASYNRKFYTKKVDTYKKFKDDLQTKLTAQQLSREEYDRLVREERKKVNVGWYGTVRHAEDALQHAQDALASAQASGNQMDIDAALRDMNGIMQSMDSTNKLATQTWDDLTAMFPFPADESRYAVERDSYGQVKLDNEANSIPQYRTTLSGELELDGEN